MCKHRHFGNFPILIALFACESSGGSSAGRPLLQKSQAKPSTSSGDTNSSSKCCNLKAAPRGGNAKDRLSNLSYTTADLLPHLRQDS
uniref:Putative secreted protein n=1 Tax=Panstrongylus lignarius TaxID=156445 RepID=A0A224XS45_9HEMI